MRPKKEAGKSILYIGLLSVTYLQKLFLSNCRMLRSQYCFVFREANLYRPGERVSVQGGPCLCLAKAGTDVLTLSMECSLLVAYKGCGEGEVSQWSPWQICQGGVTLPHRQTQTNKKKGIWWNDSIQEENL